MKEVCGSPRGRLRWLAGALVAVGPFAAASPDPPREYRVRGTLVATVDGARCCGETRFTGRFRAAYQVESSGTVRLGGFSFELDDRDVSIPTGFLDFTEVMTLRCAGGSTFAPAYGSSDGPEWLKLPPGALDVRGGFARGDDGEAACSGNATLFRADNATEMKLHHLPASDRIQFDAELASTLPGEPDADVYVLHVSAVGRFENRPPEAVLVFRYPDGEYPQGGCPAYPFWNGQSWEQRAEANAPQGLVAHLVSHSSDPDGPWGGADVFTDRWFDRRGGTSERLADGRDVGPFVFGWGPEHSVELMAFDTFGASAVDRCVFRVVDTTPPVVTAPADLITGCTTSGGATPGSSPPLTAFLAAATAHDGADPAPTRLPARLDGADVTASTLFPADGVARTVSLRFRDFTGNEANAGGLVTVVDGVAPAATLVVNRPQLAPDLKFWPINVSATLADDCGAPVSLRLISIKSNAPSFDAADISGAAYGTDDRAFFLFSRPAGPGSARVYAIVYEAKDAAGNARLAQTTVTVLATGPALVAAFDAALRAPRCAAIGRSCDSGPGLHRGRSVLGPEANQPNTILGSCADGNAGVFHADESIDRLVVGTLDGSEFAAGRTVRVEASVWAHGAFSADHVDLYSAADATSPAWTHVATLTPGGPGAQILSATYTLPAGTQQVLRARLRRHGGPMPCGAGPYDDHDDLIFSVR